jgi:hypothetical protein
MVIHKEMLVKCKKFTFAIHVMEEFAPQECKKVHIFGPDSRRWAHKKKSRFKQLE